MRRAPLLLLVSLAYSQTNSSSTGSPHGAPARPAITLPRLERILEWSPQERPVGFRNMQDIAPVHRIPKGKTVFVLPYGSPELAVRYTSEGRTWDTTAFMEHNNVAGLLVIRSGRILLERYALGFDENSLWTSFSVAKSITSTLLGAAVADGLVHSLDDLVVRYLPALKHTAYDGVTLRHILNMTSGVQWNENYDDPESDVNRCHRATDASFGSPLLTYLARLRREAQPGTKWVYKTAETDLVGELVMAVTQKSLSTYLSEKIWSSFGMEQDAYWMVRHGRELGGCCLSAGLRDFGRFGLFMLAQETRGENRVVPRDWFLQATTSSSPARSALRSRGPAAGYGFQWWVAADAPQTFSARGIFGQSIHLNPAEHRVIVTLSAWPTPLDQNRRDTLLRYQQALTAALPAQSR